MKKGWTSGSRIPCCKIEARVLITLLGCVTKLNPLNNIISNSICFGFIEVSRRSCLHFFSSSWCHPYCREIRHFAWCTGASLKVSKRASPTIISLEVSTQSQVMYKLSYFFRALRRANISIRHSTRAVFLPCCFSHYLWFLPVFLWMSGIFVFLSLRVREQCT